MDYLVERLFLDYGLFQAPIILINSYFASIGSNFFSIYLNAVNGMY